MASNLVELIQDLVGLDLKSSGPASGSNCLTFSHIMVVLVEDFFIPQTRSCGLRSCGPSTPSFWPL